MHESRLAGKDDITGHGIFEYPSDAVMVPRGIEINFKHGVQPAEEFRAMQWGSVTPHGIAPEQSKGIKLASETWIKWRARCQQNGYRASEITQYGFENLPVSNTQIETKDQGQVSAAVYNINASSHLSGHAEQAEDFGRSLGVSRVLLRAPGDLLTTTHKTYDNQTIVAPGGRAAGYQMRHYF